MPVLEGIRKRFETEHPFRGLTLSAVLHVESKTAALALALQAGGADVRLAAGNPLSTDDDAVAALREAKVETHAVKGESVAAYRAGIQAMLDADPDVIIDDGADLVALVHTDRKSRGKIRGSTEETTTGVTRLKALERTGGLLFPAIDVNDAEMKHLFDNRYGTGQSTMDGIFSATNLLIAGKVCVVAGYGWCGKGVAARLRGLGGEVVVTEVDPVRAIEARLDGFRGPTDAGCGTGGRPHRHRHGEYPRRPRRAFPGPEGRLPARERRPLRRRGLADRPRRALGQPP